MEDKNKQKRKRKIQKKSLQIEADVKRKQVEEDYIKEVEKFTNEFKTPLTSYELKRAIGYDTSFKFTKMDYWYKYMELVKKVEEQRQNNKNKAEITENDILEELLNTQNLTTSEESIIKNFLHRNKNFDEETR